MRCDAMMRRRDVPRARRAGGLLLLCRDLEMGPDLGLFKLSLSLSFSLPQAAASATPLLGASQNSSLTPLRRAPKSSTMVPLLEESVRTASVLSCSLYRSARLLSAASAE